MYHCILRHRSNAVARWLALSGANTYTGGTTIEAGTLLVQTKNASGTGTGPVQVNAGTLGGRGKMSGAVTIGGGTGAFLAPGVNGAAGLTTQSALTFNSDGIYSCEVIQAERRPTRSQPEA